MTTTELNTPAPTGKREAATSTKSKHVMISDLAQEIEQKMEQIRHIALVISQECCDLPQCDTCAPKRKDTEERIILFADLVESVAEQARDIGEKIECADTQVRQLIRA